MGSNQQCESPKNLGTWQNTPIVTTFSTREGKIQILRQRHILVAANMYSPTERQYELSQDQYESWEERENASLTWKVDLSDIRNNNEGACEVTLVTSLSRLHCLSM